MSIHCKGHKDSCHSTVALMVSRGVIGISHDEEFANPTEFEAWAKNRARAAIAKATGVQS